MLASKRECVYKGKGEGLDSEREPTSHQHISADSLLKLENEHEHDIAQLHLSATFIS